MSDKKSVLVMVSIVRSQLEAETDQLNMLLPTIDFCKLLGAIHL